MNVDELRTYPRTLLDLDDEDLPTPLIDRWISEGFQKIARRVRRFPRFEVAETVTTVSGTKGYTLTSVRKPLSVHGPHGVLEWADDSTAREDWWLATTEAQPSWPRAWSIFGGQLRLYPTPDDAYDLTVLGYREPSVGWLADPAGEPDLPDQFHEVLAVWIMYRTYLQQDDPQLAEVELRNFETMLGELIEDEVPAPASTAGLVMGGGRRGQRFMHGGTGARLPFPWE